MGHEPSKYATGGSAFRRAPMLLPPNSCVFEEFALRSWMVRHRSARQLNHGIVFSRILLFSQMIVWGPPGSLSGKGAISIFVTPPIPSTHPGMRFSNVWDPRVPSKKRSPGNSKFPHTYSAFQGMAMGSYRTPQNITKSLPKHWKPS